MVHFRYNKSTAFLNIFRPRQRFQIFLINRAEAKVRNRVPILPFRDPDHHKLCHWLHLAFEPGDLSGYPGCRARAACCQGIRSPKSAVASAVFCATSKIHIAARHAEAILVRARLRWDFVRADRDLGTA